MQHTEHNKHYKISDGSALINQTGFRLNIKGVFPGLGISIIKIRPSYLYNGISHIAKTPTRLCYPGCVMENSRQIKTDYNINEKLKFK